MRYKFCDKDGAEVAEDTTFDVYLQMNKEKDGVSLINLMIKTNLC